MVVTYAVRMSTKTPPPGTLLRPAQVAALLGVARQTVHDYESRGDLVAERTPGGHRRYPAGQPLLAARLEAQQPDQEPACRWAHGPVVSLDHRGLCPVCAEGDQ